MEKDNLKLEKKKFNLKDFLMLHKFEVFAYAGFA